MPQKLLLYNFLVLYVHFVPNIRYILFKVKEVRLYYLNKTSTMPFYLQLYHALKNDIERIIQPGTKLPSIRQMAH